MIRFKRCSFCILRTWPFKKALCLQKDVLRCMSCFSANGRQDEAEEHRLHSGMLVWARWVSSDDRAEPHAGSRTQAAPPGVGSWRIFGLFHFPLKRFIPEGKFILHVIKKIEVTLSDTFVGGQHFKMTQLHPFYAFLFIFLRVLQMMVKVYKMLH